MKRKAAKNAPEDVQPGVVSHVIVTAIAGLVFWIIGELLFPGMTEKLYTPLGIGIYFLLFGAFVSLVLFILSWNHADFSNPVNKGNRRSDERVLAIGLALLLVFSFVFELLYELGDDTLPEPTSYIFLIDDTGSMTGTEEARVTAIRDIMSSPDTTVPYAVYMFTTGATLLQPMGYYQAGDEDNFILNSSGGTDILGSISDVLADLANGVLTGAGDYPKILLLTDGASSRFGLKSVAKSCRKAFASVSTVGIGYCDESFLQNIANLTGGVYVYCTDASNLSASLSAAIATNTDRNLLSQRVTFLHNGLYAFLRVFFLVLLGLLWSYAKTRAMWEKTSYHSTILTVSIICCVCAALIMEFFADVFAIRLVRLIFCVLWAITPGHWMRYRRETAKAFTMEPVPTETPAGDRNALWQAAIAKRAPGGQGSFQIQGTPSDVPAGNPFEPVNDPFSSGDPFGAGGSAFGAGDPFHTGSNPFDGGNPFNTGSDSLGGGNPFDTGSASFGTGNPFSDSNPFGTDQ